MRAQQQELGEPLRVAMVGAGIFATQSHGPVLQSNPKTLQCVAVWSRRLESACVLAKTFGDDCDAYGGSRGFQTLLSRSDIYAVSIALPISVQPDFVLKALEAGKHVLSEKPIAYTVKEASKLLHEYHATFAARGLVWNVAENFRYESAWRAAARAVQNTIGTPLLLSLTLHAPFAPNNKYLQTDWRKGSADNSGEAPFFIDVFVHGVAAMRLVAGSAPKKVSASFSSHCQHIPGWDTMAGHVHFENGLQGVVNVTFCSSGACTELVVTGTEGRVELKRTLGKPGYQVTDGNGDMSFHAFGGVEAEFQAFAEICKNGVIGHTANAEANIGDYNSPDEALADIAFVEAFVESGKEGGAIRHVHHQQLK